MPGDERAANVGVRPARQQVKPQRLVKRVVMPLAERTA